MNLEQILQFIIAHNAIIIEGLIAAILLTVLFLALRAFLFTSDGPAEGSSSSMMELEATLKKLLEQAGKVPLTIAPENQTGGSGGAGDLGSGAQAAQLSEQINTLRKELEGKQKEIEQIKSAAGATAAAPGGMSDDDKSKLEAQIKDLQAKLQEYEIISEDIADLSFYKEQNAKLQKELEAKGGAAPAATPPALAAPDAPMAAEATPAAASAPAASSPAAAKPEPEIVGKSQGKAETATEAPVAAPAAEPAVEAAPATEATPAPAAEAAPAAEMPPVENVVDDQLMAEFAAAVQKQKTGDPAAAAAPAAAAPKPAAPATATPATPAAPAEKSAPKAEDTSVLGEVDIEKMVQEAGGISLDGPEVTAEQALGAGIDEEKLLQEAKALQGVNPDEKKLMGDFENFVKKNEG